LPQNLENLEKYSFVKNVSENLEKSGGNVEKHIGQGKVRDLFFGYSFLYTYNYYTLSEKNKLQKQYRGEYALS